MQGAWRPRSAARSSGPPGPAASARTAWRGIARDPSSRRRRFPRRAHPLRLWLCCPDGRKRREPNSGCSDSGPKLGCRPDPGADTIEPFAPRGAAVRRSRRRSGRVAFSVSLSGADGIGAMKVRRVKPTIASTVPLSLPKPGRPNLSSKRSCDCGDPKIWLRLHVPSPRIPAAASLMSSCSYLEGYQRRAKILDMSITERPVRSQMIKLK